MSIKKRPERDSNPDDAGVHLFIHIHKYMFKYMKFMYLNTEEALECEVQIHEYEYA